MATEPSLQESVVAPVLSAALQDKLDALRATLRALGSALVCFSGGIDSALLLRLAVDELGERAVALTAVSPSLAERELAGAREFAQQLGARHVEVRSNEMARPGYVQNGPDRCFHCKSELYEIAARVAAGEGLEAILNGTNVGDLGDYRPGLEAAKLARARSPFVEAGFTKTDVRAVARALQIPLFDKPAAACLASRLPYGMAVTRERLEQVERFEAALVDLGFRLVRVRHHGSLARIEVPAAELPLLADPTLCDRLVKLGNALGFQYVTLDLAGYRRGSHNELLPARKLPVL